MGIATEVNFEEMAKETRKVPAPAEYRKKPVVISALKWDGTDECLGVLLHWMNNEVLNLEDKKLGIETLEGTLEVSVGDYVIRGVKGEFYPCKPDIFEATYEQV